MPVFIAGLGGLEAVQEERVFDIASVSIGTAPAFHGTVC